jgi:hypothetical protein
MHDTSNAPLLKNLRQSLLGAEFPAQDFADGAFGMVPMNWT